MRRPRARRSPSTRHWCGCRWVSRRGTTYSTPCARRSTRRWRDPAMTDEPQLPGFDEALTLDVLRERVQGCTACDLYKHATQAVFGEGPTDASLMLMGEVPGDQEDKQGH